MGISREGRISICIGIIVAVVLYLTEPKQVAWRLTLLAVLAIILVFVAKELDWVKQRAFTLSIINGDKQPSEQTSYVRLGFAVFIAFLLVIVFGFFTWPEAPPRPLIASQVSSVSFSIPQTSTQIPKATAPPNVTVPAGKPALPTKPRASKKPEPKSKPIPDPYPIVLATASPVTYDPNTRKITVVVKLLNSTSTEANVHVTMSSFWNQNGNQSSMGATVERDIALGPPPYDYELSVESTLTVEGDLQYTIGNGFMSVVGSASYPDRGGKTIYHFTGNTKLKVDHLDLVQSEWEHTSQP